MSWQILIAASIFLYSISILLQRLLLKEEKSSPVAYSIFFQLTTGIIIAVFGFLFGSMQFPNIKPIFPNILLMIALYGFGTIFSFRALKKIEASRFTVLFSSRAFFTVVFSSLLLKEFLTGRQILGALLIFAGVIIVSQQTAKLGFGRGEIWALFSALLFGAATTNDRYLLNFFEVYPYITLGFIAPPLLVILVYPHKLKKLTLFLRKKRLKRILFLCLIYAFWAITFFSALQKADNSSQAVSVFTTNVVATVILSIIFLGERENLAKKISGAFLSFLGLLMFV